jgi:diguanylate cyclase (GGDEF)-like protein
MGPIAATRDITSDLSEALAGESHRRQLTEVLRTTLDEAIKLRASCGFLLVAIDDLDRINDTHGSDVRNAVVAAVENRLRTQLRGKDHLVRYGEKFGVVITNCTPDAMQVAAERLLAGAREEVVLTDAGTLAVTITIGGVIAPRHGRMVREVLMRAQEAHDEAKLSGGGAFHAYRPSAEQPELARAS